MASSALASAASYTAGAIPLILTVIVAAAGVVAVSTAVAFTLKAIGFTAAGPAAGSCAAAWMSSTAIANGGGVEAGSLYSALQATAMRGGKLLGEPAVLAAGVVAGAVAWQVWF